ncbi:MAG: hypothetical protein K0S33_1522 [Bacteroidetes bacterium]|jgi:hypothetical protein|nr:hypothetical protein [Bacteroidota bacterium]
MATFVGSIGMKTFSQNILILLFTLHAYFSDARVKPMDKSILNYTQVLFEYPAVKNSIRYKLEIATVKDTETPKEYTSNSTVKIINDLAFGQSYKWRVIAFNKKEKQIFTSTYFTFSIKNTDLVNTNIFRLRINYSDPSVNPDDLVFIDYNRIAVNRKGEPVWYLPDVPGKVNFMERIRDLKMTKDGTFTFLNSRSALECDITGTILWEAPVTVKDKKDSAGFYHHCFTKLKNGNYMVLGNHFVYKPIPASWPESKIKKLQETKKINGVLCAKVEYGSIMEFNAGKELVWYWNPEKYLDDATIFSHGNADTLDNPTPHMNAFDVDEEKGLVSVGFRDLSRIIVIDKKTGAIVTSYGENKSEQGQFKFQHDARFLKDGRIAIFNNNDITLNQNAVSSVQILSRPDTIAKRRGVEWEFPCNFDSLSDGRSLKGGGVTELGNSNLFVSMGQLNRVFEVSRNKKIIWDGFFEQYSGSEKKWKASPQYRASPAPSLYPNYFSAEVLGSSARKKQIHLELKITNEGSSADAYTIGIRDDTGIVIEQFDVTNLMGGESNTGSYVLGMEKHPKIKKLIIEIKSLTNPENTKKIVYEL